MSLIQPDAQQWSEMLASFIRNWVLCKDCPPVKRPHMLKDAPETCSHLSTSNSQPRLSNPMLPSPLDFLKLAYSSCKNDLWTSCPHLDPRSHLPSNPTIFCLWLRLPSLNTQSVCISVFQFQLGFSCLPLCNLLLYLLLVPISVISLAQTTWSSIPDNAYSSYLWPLLFQFLLLSGYFPSTLDLVLYPIVYLYLLLIHTPEYHWLFMPLLFPYPILVQGLHGPSVSSFSPPTLYISLSSCCQFLALPSNH